MLFPHDTQCIEPQWGSRPMKEKGQCDRCPTPLIELHNATADARFNVWRPKVVKRECGRRLTLQGRTCLIGFALDREAHRGRRSYVTAFNFERACQRARRDSWSLRSVGRLPYAQRSAHQRYPTRISPETVLFMAVRLSNVLSSRILQRGGRMQWQ